LGIAFLLLFLRRLCVSDGRVKQGSVLLIRPVTIPEYFGEGAAVSEVGQLYQSASRARPVTVEHWVSVEIVRLL